MMMPILFAIFDAAKLITCGEGGAAVIKNPDIMMRFKEFSYLGLPSRKNLDLMSQNKTLQRVGGNMT